MTVLLNTIPTIISGDEEEHEKPLEPGDATRYRGLTARANYLAADRTDLMYATKEICRHMATPTIRLTTQYAWQGEENEVTGYSDSDWAG